MPMQRDWYPENWEEIAFAVKQEANWICEKCNRPCRKKFGNQMESAEAFCDRLRAEYGVGDGVLGDVKKAIGRYTLTVAHLNHRPEDCDRSNLRAWCSRCHVRHDARERWARIYVRREKLGQLTLLEV